MSTALKFDPGTINQAAAAPYTLGQVYSNGSALYEFVQLTDAVNATNGMVAEQASTTGYIVTVDRAGGSAVGRAPRGVFVGNVTAGNYGFIQIRGIHSAIKDAANALTTLTKFTSHASTDGDAKATAAYTEVHIGYALANAGGGVFIGMIEVGG